MMALKVLHDVEKDLAEKVTQILIRRGWDASHQGSFPFCDVLVRAEEPAIQSLQKILEQHIVRDEKKIGIRLTNEYSLWYEIPRKPTDLKPVFTPAQEERPTIGFVLRDGNQEELKLLTEILDEETDSIVLCEFHDGVPGKLVYANKAAYEMRGYRRDEFTQMKSGGSGFLDSGGWTRANLDELIQKGKADFETELLCKDESRLPAHVHARIINLGERSFILNTARDIKELKNTRELLRSARERIDYIFSNIIEELPIGIAITTSEGKTRLCNKYLRELYGYETKEEFTQVPILERYFDPADRERVLKLLAQGPVRDFEMRLKKKDGTPSWVSISSLSYVNEDGENPHVTIFHDIDSHRKAEEELELRAQLLDAASDAIFLKRLDGRIVYMNEAAVSTFGYTREEMSSRALPQLVDPNQRPVWDERLKEIIDRGQAKFQIVLQRKDGFSIPVEINARLINCKGQDYVLSLLRDISEREKAEAQLQVYHQQLQSLASETFLAEEKERRRIASEVHDRVTQSLAIYNMKLKALLGKELPAPLAEALRELQSHTDELIEETRSLTFDLSSPLLYEIGLEAALDKLLEEYRMKFGINCNLHTYGRPAALNEEMRVTIFQAVRELLVNVIKHARANNINVSVRTRGKLFFVEVEDDGIGFDVKQIFVSVNRTGGFGLFSIRERLRYHGGDIRIVSRDGSGTKVTLSVPLVEDKP